MSKEVFTKSDSLSEIALFHSRKSQDEHTRRQHSRHTTGVEAQPSVQRITTAGFLRPGEISNSLDEARSFQDSRDAETCEPGEGRPGDLGNLAAVPDLAAEIAPAVFCFGF